MRIKEMLSIIKNSNIQYKLYGEDKIHSLNLLNYLFFKGKIFKNRTSDDDKLSYLVKENVEFIKFYNFFNYYLLQKMVIIAEDNTKVEIYEDNLGGPLFIQAKNLKLDIKNNLISLVATILDSTFVKIAGDFFEISEASKTSIHDYNIDTMTIDSKILEILHASSFCTKLYHCGEFLSIKNIDSEFGKINSSALNVSISNSCIKANKLSITFCNNPKIINSSLFLKESIEYGYGSLGNDVNGILIDDSTFNEDIGLELKRANLSYILKKILKKVETEKMKQMLPYFNEIDKRINYLTMQYENERHILEKEKNIICDFYGDLSVKKMIKKK